MKKILFSGDSFTWGESIELENKNFLELLKSGDVKLDYSKMPMMGYNYDHFRDISSEINSIEHRTKYRFPTLVSKHFNAIGYVKEQNGGANDVNLDSIWNFQKDKSKLDLIVFQMTHVTRDFAHLYYHKVLSNVPHANDENIDDFLRVIAPMWMTFDKNISIDEIDDFIFEDAAEKSMFWKPNMIKDLIKYFDEDFDKFWLYHYEAAYNSYISKIENLNNNVAPVLIIGTWNDYDSHMESKLPIDLQIKLNKFKVKIGGYKNLFDYIQKTDGSDYSCSTIEIPEILRNHHPTIQTHKEIANSLISKIERRKLL